MVDAVLSQLLDYQLVLLNNVMSVVCKTSQEAVKQLEMSTARCNMWCGHRMVVQKHFRHAVTKNTRI